MDQEEIDLGWTSKRIALVTGSATGIGANIAVDLAATGEYFVIVTGRNAISMQRVVASCNRAANASRTEKAIPSACAFGADLTDHQQLERLVEFVKCKFQRLDVLVNNACWRGKFASPLECGRDSFGDFKNVILLNVSVPMYIIHKCLIPLNRQQSQREHQQPSSQASSPYRSIVINISSVASQTVVPLHSYSISKACLSELSKLLADLADDLGILSLTISPGPVLTDERPHHQTMSNLTLMDRVGTTQEISNVVMFALRNATMFNGKDIHVDGGFLAKQKFASPPGQSSSKPDATCGKSTS